MSQLIAIKNDFVNNNLKECSICKYILDLFP